MNRDSELRIVSLLPSLTETVCRLGMKKNLVGRSHECDYPASIWHLPALTEPKYPASDKETSQSIHRSITELVETGLSVYSVDGERLAALKPDIILTQDHCEVCAVSLSDLKTAVKEFVDENVDVLSVAPSTVNEIYDSFRQVADTINQKERGEKLVEKISSRFKELENQTAQEPKPTVVAIEWLEPVMTGGNWMPELIEIAGGVNKLSKAGSHSPWIDWKTVVDENPEILLILPCGYSITKTLSEMDALTTKNTWDQIKAVQNNQVYILDGNQYFNRSGPRILESAEILAQIFYPAIFPPTLEGDGWIRYQTKRL